MGEHIEAVNRSHESEEEVKGRLENNDTGKGSR